MRAFLSPEPSEEKVLVTLDVHPLDYAGLEEAARLSGLELRDFCLLAIHSAARAKRREAYQSVNDAVISSIRHHALFRH